MPLFDATNPLSLELCTALKLADVIAAQPRWLELTEKALFDDARSKIFIGHGPLPANGTQFTRDEIDQLFCHGWITPPEGSMVVVAGGQVGERQSVFDFGLRIKRIIRDSEDENDIFNYFWDRTSKLLEEITDATDPAESPSVRSARRTSGPWLNDPKVTGAQGDYIFADFMFECGFGLENAD